MRNGYGQSANNGKKKIKTKIQWIGFFINWCAMAKNNCKKCYGRGYEGYELQTKQQKELGIERDKIMCSCVAERWSTMTDRERMVFAVKKDNADSIVEKAKEGIKEIAKEYGVDEQ